MGSPKGCWGGGNEGDAVQAVRYGLLRMYSRGGEEDPADSPRPDEVEDLGPDVVAGEVVEPVRVVILVDDVNVDAVPSPFP